MEYTVVLLEKERKKLFDKAKKISDLIKVHSDLADEYRTEYKDLDEKLLKSGFIWGEHQRSEIPSNYIFLTKDKRIIKTNFYEIFEHFSFFKKIDIDLILEMLD